MLTIVPYISINLVDETLSSIKQVAQKYEGNRQEPASNQHALI